MNPMLPSPDTLTGDPFYPNLKEYVVGSTGLTYYIDKDPDLARRIVRRLESTGIEDCNSYLDVLRDPVRGPAELDELIAEITIGETYFFRHEEHFDALRDVILPDLLARNRISRSLRIWCPGCAHGPEPYSVAILLRREFARQILGWNVTILGTDINRRCLARAREGKFEEWALRGVTENLRQDCFVREGKSWSIAPRHKEWVSFQYHNLVEDHFPSLLNNLSAFDLIICRNVMIYFGAELMKKIIGQFHASLVPGGWLLVGPTEPNMTSFTSFRTVNAPGVTLYQKPDHAAPVPACALVAIPSLPPLQAPVAPLTGVLTAPSPPQKSVEAGPNLADVRRHADRGEWENAARGCMKLLEKDNLNSSVHFYYGLVSEQMRKYEDAERSLRRAIYLDRKSVLAHYHLGLLLQSRGDRRLAAHCFENVLELLKTRRVTDVFPDADGITVGEMKKLARMHLDILCERA